MNEQSTRADLVRLQARYIKELRLAIDQAPAPWTSDCTALHWLARLEAISARLANDDYL